MPASSRNGYIEPLTPEQLAALRGALPPFAAGAAPSPLLREFCRFYRIDFAEHSPDVQHRAGTVASGEYRLAVHLWQRRGATHNLLLVHGYLDHTGLFGKLIAHGLARRCNVLIFDLPGHGLSTGEPAAIGDFSEYARALADVLAAVALPDLPQWVMAQSTGGAVLIEFARRYCGSPPDDSPDTQVGAGARDPSLDRSGGPADDKRAWPFAATVLLAPLVRPAGWLRIRVAHILLGRLIQSVSRKFRQNSSDPAFLEFIQRDPLQSQRLPVGWIKALRRWVKRLPRQDLGVGPALVLQGDNDHTVAWRYNLEFVASLFPGSQLHILPGAGHQLANESTEIRQACQPFVESYLAARGLPLQTAAEEADPGLRMDRASSA